MNPRNYPPCSLRLAAVFTLPLFACFAQAASYDWVAASGSTWATGWTGGAVPTTGDDLTVLGPLNAVGVLDIDVAAAASAKTINFTDTSSVTLGNINSGANQTLTLQNGLTTGAGAVTIGSATANQGVLIALGASQTWNIGSGGLTANNAISGSFGLTKSGSGTLTLNGANTYTGATTISGGTLKLDGNTGSLAATAIIGNGGTFVYDNTNSTGTKTQSLGAVTASSGATTISNILGGASSSTLTVASQAARTAGATLNYTTSGAGASIVTTTGAAFDRGVFFNGSNYAVETSGGAITSPTYVAYVSGSGFFSTSLSGGTITAGTGNHWLIDQAASLAGGNFGSSTFKFSGSHTLTNTGTLTLGGFLVTGGQAVISGSGSVRVGTAGGDVVIRTDLSSDSLNINQNVVTTNSTTPTLITKSGAGTLVLNGSGNTYGGNTAVNEGTLKITRSNGLGFGGNNISTTLGVGTTTVAAGAKLVLSGGNSALTVNEPITLNGGSLENDSTANAVTIDSGVAGLQLSNLGTGYSGTISIAFGSGGATATATQSGGIINNLTLTGAGSGYTSAPTVTITGSGGGSGAVATAVLSSVKLNGSANTIGGAGNLVINAAIANGTSSGGFSKIGAGTVTLNGVNTYTGGTTVSDGALVLGAADRIADASNLVMSGGTFATGGFGETLGTLTLTAASTIDLGSGASALVFSDSSSTSWGSSIILSFVNFTDGVDSIRIGTSDDGLTVTQLGQIRINGQLAAIDSNGFLSISAIPEPSSFAALAGIALFGFAALRRRRI